jgi:hypothetical protein
MRGNEKLKLLRILQLTDLVMLSGSYSFGQRGLVFAAYQDGQMAIRQRYSAFE